MPPRIEDADTDLSRRHSPRLVGGDGARFFGVASWRGYWRLWRGIQGHRGDAREVWRRTRRRHTDLGIGHRGGRGRGGADGNEAGGGDAIHGLRLLRSGPDCQHGGENSLPLGGEGTDRGPWTLGGGRARRPVSLAIER